MHTLTGKRLEKAGFTVLKEIAIEKFLFPSRRGKWYEVLSPSGEKGIVLKAAGYHFFYSDFVGTASHSDLSQCHLGSLGDAIDTDSQLRAYSKAVLNAPQSLMDRCESLYVASSQVYNS